MAEIATTAVAAAIAASHLGLQQVHLLMVIFFATTLAGQFLSSMLGRMSGAPIRNRERAE